MLCCSSHAQARQFSLTRARSGASLSISIPAARRISFFFSSPHLTLSSLSFSQSLSKLLGDNAPACRKDQKFDNYFGRKIAVDASMHIYQFMVRRRRGAGRRGGGGCGGWGERGKAGAGARVPAHAPSSRPTLTLAHAPPPLSPKVVVGRMGDQQLTDETGEVTRYE